MGFTDDDDKTPKADGAEGNLTEEHAGVAEPEVTEQPAADDPGQITADA